MGSGLSSGCAAAAVALSAVGCAMPPRGTAPPAAAAARAVPPDPARAVPVPASVATPCALPPDEWVWFRDFWFDPARADIRAADAEKIVEIVSLLRREPTRCVAIDGTTRDRATDLGHRRIANLRDALLRAGVDPRRIRSGDLGHPGLRHAQRVEVLVGLP